MKGNFQGLVGTERHVARPPTDDRCVRWRSGIKQSTRKIFHRNWTPQRSCMSLHSSSRSDFFFPPFFFSSFFHIRIKMDPMKNSWIWHYVLIFSERKAMGPGEESWHLWYLYLRLTTGLRTNPFHARKWSFSSDCKQEIQCFDHKLCFEFLWPLFIIILFDGIHQFT